MIYFLQSGDRVKIGYSINMENRMPAIKTASPFDVSLLAVMEGDRIAEQALHEKFANLRVKGEWFKLDKAIIDHLAAHATQHRISSADAPLGSLTIKGCAGAQIEVNGDSIYVHVVVDGVPKTVLRVTGINGHTEVVDYRGETEE